MPRTKKLSFPSKPAPTPSEAILEIAQRITEDIAQKTNWSLWHIGEYVRKMDNSKKAISIGEQAKQYASLWGKNKPPPFGTCVDLSYFVWKKIRMVLRSHEDASLRGHWNDVKLLSLLKDDGTPEHCVVAVPLPEECCIVVDLMCHFTAFSVPLDGSFETAGWLDLHGNKSTEIFTYEDNPDEEPVLIAEGIFPSEELLNPIFREISYNDAIKYINFRIGREQERSYINITQLWPKRPKKLVHVEVPDGFLVTTCRISLDNSRRSILIQVPQSDYLSVRKNANRVLTLEGFGMLERVNRAVGNIKLPLKYDVVLKERVKLAADVVDELGLERGEFLRIVRLLAPSIHVK